MVLVAHSPHPLNFPQVPGHQAHHPKLQTFSSESNLLRFPNSKNPFSQIDLYRLLDQMLTGKFLEAARATFASSFQSNFTQPQFRASDFSPDKLINFLNSTPDPVAWFTKTFPNVAANQIRYYPTQLGLVFELQEAAYDDFAVDERIKSPGEDSMGVTLSLKRLPEEQHDFIVVVNCGHRFFNGKQVYTGPEHRNLVDKTIVHEILHVLFDNYFRSCPFVSNIDLSNRLTGMNFNDPSIYTKLFKELADGLLDMYKTEIISYFGTGDFNPKDAYLGTNFWIQDTKNVDTAIAHLPIRQAADIKHVFHQAYQYYINQSVEFSKLARGMVDSLSKVDMIQELLLAPITLPDIEKDWSQTLLHNNSRDNNQSNGSQPVMQARTFAA